MGVFYGMKALTQLVLTAVGVALAGSGCVTSREWRIVGEGDALAPQAKIVTSDRRPLHVAIDLDKPAYVTVLYVRPGRGAAVLYPVDTATDGPLFRAGVHELDVGWPHTAQLLSKSDARKDPQRDSLDAGRRSQISAPTIPAGRRVPDWSAPSPSTRGYLLVLVTSGAPKTSTLRGRLLDRTLPVDDDEALRAVAKLATAGLSGDTRAYASSVAR